MPGPDRSVAQTRLAVRQALTDADSRVLVGVSGGADSLALAAALAFECDGERPAGRSVEVRAVIVDHGLQPGSDQVAASAAHRCRDLGLQAEVVAVEVARHGAGGPEARARDARHAALAQVAARVGADAVFLGHTLDDQAEQVLLGLARGSGTRSLSGMPRERDGMRRPFLGLARATTRAACAAQGIEVWDDPHNDDPRFLRVRARRLLGEVEHEIPGIAAALARSADLLRDDADALDEIADQARARIGGSPWPPESFADHPAAIRRRLWRTVLLEEGVPGGALTSTHLAAVDALITSWRGQGPVDLPGGVQVRRLRQPPAIAIGRPLDAGTASPTTSIVR